MKACSTRSGQGGGASIVLRCIASNWIGVPDVPEHGLAGAANRAQFVAADLSVEPERVSAQRHGTGRPFRFVKRQNEGETERQRERERWKRKRNKKRPRRPSDKQTNEATQKESETNSTVATQLCSVLFLLLLLLLLFCLFLPCSFSSIVFRDAGAAFRIPPASNATEKDCRMRKNKQTNKQTKKPNKNKLRYRSPFTAGTNHSNINAGHLLNAKSATAEDHRKRERERERKNR